MSKVYVGNLSWSTTDDTLRNAFSEYGQVLDSIVMRDHETGKSTLIHYHASFFMGF
jgi:RNA recognition motif-containing protein